MNLNLPNARTLAAVTDELTRRLGVEFDAPRSVVHCYLDTFDWRLYQAGVLLEAEEVAHEACLRLYQRESPLPPRVLTLPRLPRTAPDLPAGLVRERLGPILGNRVLLPRGERRRRCASGVRRDARDKVQVRVQVYGTPRRRGVEVRIEPVTGFAKQASRLARELRKRFDARPDDDTGFSSMTADCVPPPGNYPRWREPLRIEPDTRTDVSLQRAMRHYTGIMALNVDGARDGLDPEFLHDFRVGLRRCRTVLRRGGAAFPPQRVNAFSRDLKWLSAETSPLRDMDVLIETLPSYLSELSPEARDTLAPLAEDLRDAQATLQARFRRTLDGARFRRRFGVWSRWLHAPLPAAPSRKVALRPARSFAASAIRRVARKVYRQGDALNDQAPAEAFHELRKTLKNLRYMVDVYEELIPRKHLKRCVPIIKALQDDLGEHQDLDVHAGTLGERAKALIDSGALPPEARPVIQTVTSHLRERSARARERVANLYAPLRALSLHKRPLGA